MPARRPSDKTNKAPTLFSDMRAIASYTVAVGAMDHTWRPLNRSKEFSVSTGFITCGFMTCSSRGHHRPGRFLTQARYLFDVSVAHAYDTMAVAGGFGIVRDHQNGLTQAAVQIAQQAEDGC